MAETRIAKPEPPPDLAVLEQVVIGGDLAKLTAGQRVSYVVSLCDSLKLNPKTKPFMFIVLNGKLTLYATRDCADQLRHRDSISLSVVSAERQEDLYIVKAHASTPDGRQDEDLGVVNVTNLKGDFLANAMMKAMTKAKRRVTLSICGLGWLDETEIETIPDARPIRVDMNTGEVEQTKPEADDGDSDFLIVLCADCGEAIPAVITVGSKQYNRLDWLKRSEAKFRAQLCLKCSMDRAEVLKREAAETA